jgi:hypothetical protein
MTSAHIVAKIPRCIHKHLPLGASASRQSDWLSIISVMSPRSSSSHQSEDKSGNHEAEAALHPSDASRFRLPVIGRLG